MLNGMTMDPVALQLAELQMNKKRARDQQQRIQESLMGGGGNEPGPRPRMPALEEGSYDPQTFGSVGARMTNEEYQPRPRSADIGAALGAPGAKPADTEAVIGPRPRRMLGAGPNGSYVMKDVSRFEALPQGSSVQVQRGGFARPAGMGQRIQRFAPQRYEAGTTASRMMGGAHGAVGGITRGGITAKIQALVDQGLISPDEAPALIKQAVYKEMGLQMEDPTEKSYQTRLRDLQLRKLETDLTGGAASESEKRARESQLFELQQKKAQLEMQMLQNQLEGKLNPQQTFELDRQKKMLELEEQKIRNAQAAETEERGMKKQQFDMQNRLMGAQTGLAETQSKVSAAELQRRLTGQMSPEQERAERAQMLQQMPPLPANATPEQRAAWLQKAQNFLRNGGDLQQLVPPTDATLPGSRLAGQSAGVTEDDIAKRYSQAESDAYMGHPYLGEVGRWFAGRVPGGERMYQSRIDAPAADAAAQKLARDFGMPIEQARQLIANR